MMPNPFMTSDLSYFVSVSRKNDGKLVWACKKYKNEFGDNSNDFVMVYFFFQDSVLKS